MARASGLSISALRFYDNAGVLRPAHVDPVTGYRWYDGEQVIQARLIAALRRVSMPLTDICGILAARHDPVAVGHALDRHLRRLEDSLADARRQLDVARELIDPQEKTMTHMNVLGADLISGLASVRFAVSNDPELPALNGVLFDFDGSILRLVASDRYRLAVATVPVRDQHGPATQLIAPTALCDLLELRSDRHIELRLDTGTVTIGASRAAAIDASFPDYQRLLRTIPTQQVTIKTPDLHSRITAGPTRTLRGAPHDTDHEVSALYANGDSIEVVDYDRSDAIAFNRDFLLEALDAGAADQLVLALDGPISPLAIINPERLDVLSLLMPIRI
jgi:DNA polymerase III sliding clamp (beta) subunit (PCNA family)